MGRAELRKVGGRAPFLLAGLALVAFVALYHLQAGPKPQDRGLELRIAIFEGDERTVAHLLRLDPSLVERSQGGVPPLLRAVDYAHPRLVEQLIEAGANVNQGGHLSWPREAGASFPLERAAGSYHAPEMVTLLLQRGAHVNRSGPGGPPLVVAAARRNLTTVNLLLAAGADPTATDPEGLTPLHWAARHGSPEVVQRLLSLGVAREPLTLDGDRPVDFARRTGNWECVSLLLPGGLR